jgi:hypothetical protein
MNNFDKSIFVKNKKYNYGGRLIFTINICFMATTYEPLHLDKRSFVLWKIMDIPTSFIWIIIFFNAPLGYGDGGIFKLQRWIQNL